MTTIAASEAREQWADLLNRVHYAHERIRVIRRDKPLVAVIPVEDLELLEELELWHDSLAYADAVSDPDNQGPTTSTKALRAELGLDEGAPARTARSAARSGAS